MAHDLSGKQHTINVFEGVLPAGTRGDPLAVLGGMIYLATVLGESVTRIEKGRYQVDSSLGEIEVITSDPNEPDIA